MLPDCVNHIIWYKMVRCRWFTRMNHKIILIIRNGNSCRLIAKPWGCFQCRYACLSGDCDTYSNVTRQNIADKAAKYICMIDLWTHNVIGIGTKFCKDFFLFVLADDGLIYRISIFSTLYMTNSPVFGPLFSRMQRTGLCSEKQTPQSPMFAFIFTLHTMLLSSSPGVIS